MVLDSASLVNPGTQAPALAIAAVLHRLRYVKQPLSNVQLDAVELISVLGSGKPIYQDVFADQCWLSVTRWIHECSTTHVACQANEDGVLPTRYLHILDSGNNMSPPSVRLCENESGRMGKFAALSHVWEASKPINTTSANITEMLQGIPYQRLPKTFQHAISICIKLGLSFLWIDSLCIIQDDDLDWRTQASKMADVYTNSYITIAAHPTGDMRGSFDAGVDNGCHLSRATVFVKATQDADGTPVSIFARNTHNHEQFVSVTLDDGRSSYFQRGWCLQERLLAPRILHFMESEVLFECNQGMECECGEAARYADSDFRLIHVHLKQRLAAVLRASKGTSQTEPGASLETWKAYNSVIEDYADKSLTKCTDKLPALSGLAKLISPSLGRYHAGIWEFNLVHGLLWESNWRRMDERNACHRHPSGSFVAPSFSWASRQGGVTTFSRREDFISSTDCKAVYYAEVRQVECRPYGDDKFGEVTGGSLTLYTCGIPVAYGGEANDLGWMITLSGDGIEESSFTLDTVEDKKLAQEREIFCVELMRSEVGLVDALVVVPSHHVRGAYQRIGCISYSRPGKALPCSEYKIV